MNPDESTFTTDNNDGSGRQDSIVKPEDMIEDEQPLTRFLTHNQIEEKHKQESEMSDESVKKKKPRERTAYHRYTPDKVKHFFEAFEHNNEKPIAHLAAEHSINASTARGWIRKYKASGVMPFTSPRGRPLKNTKILDQQLTATKEVVQKDFEDLTSEFGKLDVTRAASLTRVKPNIPTVFEWIPKKISITLEQVEKWIERRQEYASLIHRASSMATRNTKVDPLKTRVILCAFSPHGVYQINLVTPEIPKLKRKGKRALIYPLSVHKVSDFIDKLVDILNEFEIKGEYTFILADEEELSEDYRKEFRERTGHRVQHLPPKSPDLNPLNSLWPELLTKASEIDPEEKFVNKLIDGASILSTQTCINITAESLQALKHCDDPNYHLHVLNKYDIHLP
ncbi:hypothetical protein QCA50_012292 [Cerrena zonata]|uniref:Transposase n=1 Tax=Cerrena zonata TaxID=2478898 RepID=A0AAW0G024_9APHY